MNKIQAMYKWSGGTDYRYLCHECSNCVKVQRGSQTVYKCLVYGNTGSQATDWRASNIACKYFGQAYEGEPVISMGYVKEKEESQLKGQISIFDLGIEL